MRDPPPAAALLAQARRDLLEQLLPALPEAQRYTARLIANALAIATREVEAGGGPDAAELAYLRALFAESAEDGSSESRAEALERLNWRLVVEIRGGHFDGDGELHRLLTDLARLRLKETNPRFLEAEEGNEEG